ncbi:hypothetical protein M440DRAFT_1397591 [Trichoderma longibrachiatum ATCC 18648]|uniref:Uncharacterized protein n=1 Tax=Trichoderma longibrachiatum ATCC 18648 TaxID=983965 RepID=A0A2T4CFE8_TRILO|nr:hypothetical protein M440DRAFT_1397591 [Trichoderma longibrachiatum ATCC 18648]
MTTKAFTILLLCTYCTCMYVLLASQLAPLRRRQAAAGTELGSWNGENAAALPVPVRPPGIRTRMIIAISYLMALVLDRNGITTPSDYLGQLLA